MKRLPLALVLVLWAAWPAEAKLEIRNIQPSYGRLGPERTKLEYYPNDEVDFRYEIAGARVTQEGKVNCEITVELTPDKGKPLPKQVFSAQGLLTFGGDVFPGFASVPLPGEAEPGVYVLKVSVRDRQRDESFASFERTVRVKKAEFAIVSPRFYYDAAGKVDAPAAGNVGQTLYVALKVIGFDRSRGRIETEMNIRVTDEDGKDLTLNPIRIKGDVENSAIVKQASHLTYKGELHFNRPGDFVLSVAIIDWVSKKTIKFETPLHVASPS